MYFGNIVDFISYSFELFNADRYFYRLIENDGKNFPFSNFFLLHDMLMSKNNKLKNTSLPIMKVKEELIYMTLYYVVRLLD